MALQTISGKAIEAIRQDNELFSAIADALNIKLVSLQSYLQRKSPKLSNAGIVKMIADKTGMSFDEISESEAVAG